MVQGINCIKGMEKRTTELLSYFVYTGIITTLFYTQILLPLYTKLNSYNSLYIESNKHESSSGVGISPTQQGVIETMHT